MDTRVIIDGGLCIGRGACVTLCPHKILYLDPESEARKVRDEEKCGRLRGCVGICPVGALNIL